jgi:hypothetical protein
MSGGVDPDSATLRSQARDAQIRFERVRVFRAPLGHGSASGTCDEVVGRFCLRFSATDETESRPPWRPPPEHPAVEEARATLDSTLASIAADLPSDGWVAGQRVFYRAEVGDWEGALEAALACRSPEPGWCGMLEGLARHGGGDPLGASRAFEDALELLPEEERRVLLDLESLLERPVQEALRALPQPERGWLEERLWLVGNPLFLAGPDALRNEHLARHVVARTRIDARNPHGLRWGDDLTELLVRFGPVVGWERVREPVGMISGPTQVSGRYSWDAKGIFPTLEGVLDPVSAPPEAFPAASFRARSRHATPTHPRIRALEARTTRFRRGAEHDSLLVVTAWRVPPPAAWDSVPPRAVDEAALFLVGVSAAAPVRHEAAPGEAGVTLARAPGEGWWLSMEVGDQEGGRAWRHREGLPWAPLPPGRLALSDLLLLRPDDDGPAPGPEDRLEDHAGRALPSDTLEERRVEVAWEVYGLPRDPDRLRFVVAVEPEGRGLFRRAGEALRILSPMEPVEIRWEEGGMPRPEVPGAADPGGAPGDAVAGARGDTLAGARADTLPPHFRRLTLDLSSLDRGAWWIRLRLEGEDGAWEEGPPEARTLVVIR